MSTGSGIATESCFDEDRKTRGKEKIREFGRERKRRKVKAEGKTREKYREREKVGERSPNIHEREGSMVEAGKKKCKKRKKLVYNYTISQCIILQVFKFISSSTSEVH